MADVLILAKNLSTGQNEASTVLKIDNSNGQLKSSLTTGTAPLAVSSTTVCTSLNADQCDGYDATDFFNLDHAQVSGILDADHGGTNKDTSGDTGIPLISSGVWSVPAVVGLTYGGTGADLDSTGPGALVQTSGGAVVTVETLDETRGGTGQTSLTTGDILYASASNVLSKLAAGTNGYVLTMGASIPTWSTPGAPGAHASTHMVTGSNTDPVTLEDLQTAAGTAGWALTNDGDGTVSWTTWGATLPDGTTNNNATLRWDTSGDAWQLNTNFDIDSSGNVSDGTWQADIIAALYGGTGIATNGSTGIPQIVGGTWTVPAVVGLTYGGSGADLSGTGPGALVQASNGATVTVEALDETRGGTGQTTITAGDLLYGSASNVISKLAIGAANQVLRTNGAGTLPEWDTFGLTELDDVTITGAAQGDILYRGASGWANLPKGADGTFLKSTTTNPAWADAGTGYTWILDGDTGTPEVIADGNTATFVGGDGIDTAVSATDTLTVTAEADVSSGGDINPVSVTSNGIGIDVSQFDGNGLLADGSGNLDIDTGSTVSFAAGSVWTFPNGVTAKGLFVTGSPVDGNHVTNKTYVDSVATGIKWKDPAAVLNLIGNVKINGMVGNLTALQIEALSPTAGDAYVVTTANGAAALLTATVGDIWQYVVTTWTKILTGVGGFVPTGTYILCSTQTTLIAPFTPVTHDAYQGYYDGSTLDPPGSGFMVAPSTGDAYVIDGSGEAAEGDIIEYTGSAYAQIEAAAAGFVAIGVRAILGQTSAIGLITPYTNATDDCKIVDFTGASNTGVNTGEAIDENALLIQDTAHIGVYDNLGYVFEGTVPTGAWIQFTGAGQITAGAGMTKTTNTININDGTLGDVNGLAISSNAIALAYNSSYFKLTSNQLDLDLTMTPTWTGAHTFSHSSGLLTNVITERSGGSGVTVDSCLIKDGNVDKAHTLGTSWLNAGENVALANIVYMETDGDLNRADANSSSLGYGTVVGIAAAAATTGNPIFLHIAGEYDPTNGPIPVKMITGLSLNVGDPVYVSATGAGGTVGEGTNDVSSFTAGDWIQKVGIVTNTDDYDVGGGYLAYVHLWKEAATLLA